MSRRSNIGKAIATGTTFMVLNTMNADAQAVKRSNNSNDSIVKAEITDYDPIKLIKPHQEYNLNASDSIYDSEDPWYSVDGINKLIDSYKKGILFPDKDGMDGKALEYFEKLSIPGLSEFSTQKKDQLLKDEIVKAFNNKCPGEPVGKITLPEDSLIYKAMEASGLSEVKFLLHKHYDKVLKIITYTRASGKIERDTVQYPARDYLQGYRLEDALQCTEPNHSQKAFRPFIEANLKNSNLNKILSEYGINTTKLKSNFFMPELGLGVKIGKWGVEVDGAYGNIKKTGVLTFLNGPGNGYTIDHSHAKGYIMCIGAKSSFDISKMVSLCVGAQDNIFKYTITGGVKQSVTDNVVGLDEGHPKTPEPNHGSYISYGGGPMFNFGKRKNISMPINAYFTKDGFEGADIGFRYTFRGNK